MTNSKTCTKCGQIKPYSEFNNRKASPDGKQPLCRECEHQRQREYNAKNSARNTARAVDWNKTNKARRKEIRDGYLNRFPDRRKNTLKKYHDKNRQLLNAKARKHRQANMEQARSYVLARRGRIKASAKLVTVKEIIKMYASVCTYCGSSDKIEIDHIVPLSKGGRHSIGNLTPACRMCNASKGNKFLTEWRR
jgi:5-methylcytosine-specific restriction endonuclease McrA